MTYERPEDLPENVRGSLPARAQALYQEAFNAAWDSYRYRRNRRNRVSRHAVAHRIAWSAVKKEFQRTETGWSAL